MLPKKFKFLAGKLLYIATVFDDGSIQAFNAQSYTIIRYVYPSTRRWGLPITSP